MSLNFCFSINSPIYSYRKEINVEFYISRFPWILDKSPQAKEMQIFSTNRFTLTSKVG